MNNFVPSHDQIAYCLMKALMNSHYQFLGDKLGVVETLLHLRVVKTIK